MARLFFLGVAAAALTASCSANTASQERQETPSMQAEAAPTPASVAVPDNPADRAIRRELVLAIAGDPDLKKREIHFAVTNGDISVTGIVGTEEERRKINDLALNIGGVKSVANALRIAE